MRMPTGGATLLLPGAMPRLIAKESEMRKQGLKAIGLCLMAALGIMAFAASAQAEVGAHWNVNGSPITANTSVKAGLENATLSLLTQVGLNAVKILCTALEFEEAVLKVEGGSLGKIKFTGCKTFLNGTLAEKCAPRSSGAAAGTILTNLLKDLIVLHPAVSATEGYDRLEPDEGPDAPFFNILLGATCAIGSELPLYGKYTLKDCNTEGRVEKATHLYEEFVPLTDLRAFTPLTGTKVTIDGSTNVSLTGGGTFSGIPG
jgi:hypothetical protein